MVRGDRYYAERPACSRFDLTLRVRRKRPEEDGCRRGLGETKKEGRVGSQARNRKRYCARC